jgi:glycosyltransferase involved in cell wall biosynthesis
MAATNVEGANQGAGAAGQGSVSRPLRILHIGNGQAFKIKAIADAFVARGHDVHMVPIPQTEHGWQGITSHRLPEARFPGQAKVLERFLQVRAVVRRLKPDIVHAHNAWGPGWYGAATGHHPFLIHAYGGDLLPEQYQGRPALQRRLTSWTCRSADRIIVTGEHMIEAAGLLGIPRDRLMLLPRGVDLRRYRPGVDSAPLRAKLGLTGHAGPVIFSPRYQVDEPLYNLDVVIEAFARALQHIPDAVCLQLYDPARERGRAALARRAEEREIAHAYRLVPAVDNHEMPAFYNLADVVVSVPSSDGFPVTVLEASACASAIIVSDLAYCREWFARSGCGVVVPVRDPAALANAIVALSRDPARRKELGAGGRQLAEARADYEKCMDRLEDVYRDLLARRSN